MELCQCCIAMFCLTDATATILPCPILYYVQQGTGQILGQEEHCHEINFSLRRLESNFCSAQL